jgi:hypothetical protein
MMRRSRLPTLTPHMALSPHSLPTLSPHSPHTLPTLSPLAPSPLVAQHSACCIQCSLSLLSLPLSRLAPISSSVAVPRCARALSLLAHGLLEHLHLPSEVSSSHYHRTMHSRLHCSCTVYVPSPRVRVCQDHVRTVTYTDRLHRRVPEIGRRGRSHVAQCWPPHLTHYPHHTRAPSRTRASLAL